MHILATTSSSLDDLIEPVDLNQAPADVVALSFSGSDLNGLSAAWADQTDVTLATANLSELRHPMSVDLWLDKTAAKARLVLVRILGGYDRWQYGVEELARLARRLNIKLILLPGECSVRDDRLAITSTVSEAEQSAILSCFREGGPQNMRLLASRLAALSTDRTVGFAPAPEMPRAGFYRPGRGIVELADLLERTAGTAPRLPILFYRSMLLANDAAPIDALFKALEDRGLVPVPIFVGGLKDAGSLAFVRQALQRSEPAATVAATAFASGTNGNGDTIFDHFGVPVFQVIVATTRRTGWAESRRGLNPSDLAMHVVLPELDGRILAGVISFKEGCSSANLVNRPEPDRVEQVARRIAG